MEFDRVFGIVGLVFGVLGFLQLLITVLIVLK